MMWSTFEDEMVPPPCSHEEADTKFVFYALEATKHTDEATTFHVYSK